MKTKTMGLVFIVGLFFAFASCENASDSGGESSNMDSVSNGTVITIAKGN